MVKITAVYRWFDGAQFNHDYYQREHMRITRDAVHAFGLLRLESEQVLQPVASKAGQVVAATSSYFPTPALAHAALAEAGALLSADLPNYTNIKPELHISAVRTHHAPATEDSPCQNS